MNALSIDLFTIVSSIVLLLLSIASALLNPFFRFSKKRYDKYTGEDQGSATPSVSIILTPLDDISQLKKNLPAFLSQTFPTSYQVVIVIEQGDHDTESLVANIVNETRNEDAQADVYITYIPKTYRYVSKKKLAMTLGVKAAKYDWVLFTELSCRPASAQWLTLMARHCAQGNNLVIGYTAYDRATPSFRRFERMYESHYLMRATAKGMPFRTNGYNLLMRKEDFMEQDGFLGNLHLMRGEYDFLVNKYARKNCAALEISPDAWVVEDAPTDKTFLNRHLYLLASGSCLNRRAWQQLLFIMDHSGLHLSNLLCAIAAIYAAFRANWPLLGAAAVAFLIGATIRGLLARRALKDFEESISPLKALFFEHTLAFRRLQYKLRYLMADKNDFTTHKL